MNLAIIGSRSFTDYTLLEKTVNTFRMTNNVKCIISGGANGADKLAATYALRDGLELIEYLPDWDKHGKQAGYLRNVEIVQKSDYILAFWDGISKGTKLSIDLAAKHNKHIKVIKY